MNPDFLKIMYAPEGAGSGGDSSVTDKTGAEDKKDSTTDVKDKDKDKPLTKEDIEKVITETKTAIDLDWQKKFDKKNTELQKALKQIQDVEREKLSEDERKKLEQDEKDKALQMKEKEIAKKELILNTKDFLIEKEVDVSFVDFLVGEDEESTKDRIKNFKKIWDTAIEKKVNEKLGGGYKPPATTTKGNTIPTTIEGKLQSKFENIS